MERQYKTAMVKKQIIETILSILAFIIIFTFIETFREFSLKISVAIGYPQFSWLILPIIALIFYKIFILIMWHIIAYLMFLSS